MSPITSEGPLSCQCYPTQPPNQPRYYGEYFYYGSELITYLLGFIYLFYFIFQICLLSNQIYMNILHFFSFSLFVFLFLNELSYADFLASHSYPCVKYFNGTAGCDDTKPVNDSLPGLKY